MRDRLRVFVCEFITGGGLVREPLPAGLAEEGARMLSALLGDLCALGEVEVVTTRDSRLPALAGVDVRQIAPGEDPWAVWQGLIETTDCTWPIAPETGGVLERLSRTVLDCGRTLIGTRPEAVRVAASKLRCAEHLVRLGVPVVPTVAEGAEPPDAEQGWVVKPDDGAGCEATCRCSGREALRAALGRSAGRARVIQPWMEGSAASVSMLCLDGQARVLACNAQRIVSRDGVLEAQGVEVNALAAERSRLQPVAAAVARALPGLWGYVGVDLILGDAGAVVVDVNPRLTSAYAGLRPVLGCNPAALVLEMLRRGVLPVPGQPAAEAPVLAAP